MRSAKFLSVLILGFLCLGPSGVAQKRHITKPGMAESFLKLHIVIMEFQGHKELSRLPYTIPVIAGPISLESSLRMGVNVQVMTNKNIYQYRQIGTNIDCLTARSIGPDLYLFSLIITRSYLSNHRITKNIYPRAGEPPAIVNLSSQMNLLMRNGQTITTSLATDPVNGHVIRVAVTLQVLK